MGRTSATGWLLESGPVNRGIWVRRFSPTISCLCPPIRPSWSTSSPSMRRARARWSGPSSRPCGMHPCWLTVRMWWNLRRSRGTRSPGRPTSRPTRSTCFGVRPHCSRTWPSAPIGWVTWRWREILWRIIWRWVRKWHAGTPCYSFSFASSSTNFFFGFFLREFEYRFAVSGRVGDQMSGMDWIARQCSSTDGTTRDWRS